MSQAPAKHLRFDFHGQTVLITGAGQGIGLELAHFFHDAGARVAVLDRDEASLRKAWAEAGATVLRLAVDVTDGAAVAAAVASVESWGGGVDVLINNAGITRDAMVWKMTQKQWQTVLDVHLTGTFLLTHAVIPQMRARGRGRIVNVTSFTGMHGNVGQANYAAAKAGVIGFTKAVAKETARSGITVNAVSPNAATPMVAAIPADRLAALTDMVPVGRFADPAEMAAAFGFLASEEARYITGVVLPVDGGLSM